MLNATIHVGRVTNQYINNLVLDSDAINYLQYPTTSLKTLVVAVENRSTTINWIATSVAGNVTALCTHTTVLHYFHAAVASATIQTHLLTGGNWM